MNKEHITLLSNLLLLNEDVCDYDRNALLKAKQDADFCDEFFGQPNVDTRKIEVLLKESILHKNEAELDLLLMLIEYFNITLLFDDTIAPLLIQPWHHFHDRISSILVNDANENTIEFLYSGALYQCDNLDYESDYRECSRKCIFALLNIGTPDAINKIQIISNSQDNIVAQHAKKILFDNNLI